MSALEGITDKASAEAALPNLKAVETKLDELGGTVEGLPQQAKEALASLLDNSLPALKELVTKVEGIEGVGEVVKPTLDGIMAKLDAWANSPPRQSIEGGVAARHSRRRRSAPAAGHAAALGGLRAACADSRLASAREIRADCRSGSAQPGARNKGARCPATRSTAPSARTTAQASARSRSSGSSTIRAIAGGSARSAARSAIPIPPA